MMRAMHEVVLCVCVKRVRVVHAVDCIACALCSVHCKPRNLQCHFWDKTDPEQHEYVMQID